MASYRGGNTSKANGARRANMSLARQSSSHQGLDNANDGLEEDTLPSGDMNLSTIAADSESALDPSLPSWTSGYFEDSAHFPSGQTHISAWDSSPIEGFSKMDQSTLNEEIEGVTVSMEKSRLQDKEEPSPSTGMAVDSSSFNSGGCNSTSCNSNNNSINDKSIASCREELIYLRKEIDKRREELAELAKESGDPAEVVAKEINAEVDGLIHAAAGPGTSSIFKPCEIVDDTIFDTFQVMEKVSEIRAQAPTLMKVLHEGVLGRSAEDKGSARYNAEYYWRGLFACLCFLMKIRHQGCSFLSAIIGLYLFAFNVGKRIFGLLNKIGVTDSYRTATNTVKRWETYNNNKLNDLMHDNKWVDTSISFDNINIEKPVTQQRGDSKSHMLNGTVGLATPIFRQDPALPKYQPQVANPADFDFQILIKRNIMVLHVFRNIM